MIENLDLTLFELAQSLGGAILFATLFFLKNRRKDGQQFDLVKYGSTLLLALVVWGGAVAVGDTVTQGSLQNQLLMYSGAIALLDAAISAVLKGKPVFPVVVDKLPGIINRNRK